MYLAYKTVIILLFLTLALSPDKIPAAQAGARYQPNPSPFSSADASLTSPSDSHLYLPLITRNTNSAVRPKINVPSFTGTVPMTQMAIFWFGRVTPDENYVDVRSGYNPDALLIDIAIIDRRLWCSTNPSGSSLALGDSVELFLDTGAQGAGSLRSTSYKFSGQLGSWDCRESWTAYQGSSSGWRAIPFTITASTGWRGNAPNDDTDDRGWTVDYRIPFASLGLNSAPKPGTLWKLAVVVHDRNNSAGSLVSQKRWPDGFSENQPTSWADMAYGLPKYTPPPAPQTETVTLRNKIGGIVVPDAQVGGGMVCGDGLDFWTQWGEMVYPGSSDNDQINIQNQGDIADWPCFSKYFVTFPLDTLPKGKVILSAQLRMHQFGNSGGPGDSPQRSWIQVFTVGQDWKDANLTWNSAPQMTENVSQAWVDPLSSFPGWPGVLRTWDVSRAVAMAYASGTPLRLALYSADENYHSGKYFVSSDAGDWNAEARPELQIFIGTP